MRTHLLFKRPSRLGVRARYRAHRTTEPWKEPGFKCNVLTLALALKRTLSPGAGPVLKALLIGSSLPACPAVARRAKEGPNW